MNWIQHFPFEEEAYGFLGIGCVPDQLVTGLEGGSVLLNLSDDSHLCTVAVRLQ